MGLGVELLSFGQVGGQEIMDFKATYQKHKLSCLLSRASSRAGIEQSELETVLDVMGLLSQNERT